MILAPPTGQQYRDTRTKALVPPEGVNMDPLDLDVAKAIEVGDLVKPAKPAPAADTPPAAAPKAQA